MLLGFALQTPISSLIGWLYIVIRVPYKVGDRIQIDQFTGDVVEIGYFDTTLWEFAGEYLSNDVPSGRLIRFPTVLFGRRAYIIIRGRISLIYGMKFHFTLPTKAI